MAAFHAPFPNEAICSRDSPSGAGANQCREDILFCTTIKIEICRLLAVAHGKIGSGAHLPRLQRFRSLVTMQKTGPQPQSSHNRTFNQEVVLDSSAQLVTVSKSRRSVAFSNNRRNSNLQGCGCLLLGTAALVGG